MQTLAWTESEEVVRSTNLESNWLLSFAHLLQIVRMANGRAGRYYVHNSQDIR